MVNKSIILDYFKSNDDFNEIENIKLDTDTYDMTPTDQYEYDNYNSNAEYINKYSKKYAEYDRLFLKQFILKSPKSGNLNILFCGCGNLLELIELFESIDYKCYDEINLICIDLVLWKINVIEKYLSLIKSIENFHCYFYKSDYFSSLINDASLFKQFDGLYFSRCLNNLEYRKYSKFDEYLSPSKKIVGILRNYSNTNIAISQVVNGNNLEAIESENSFIEKLMSLFKVTLFPSSSFHNENIIAQKNNLCCYLYILEAKDADDIIIEQIEDANFTCKEISISKSYDDLFIYLSHLHEKYIIGIFPEINKFDNYISPFNETLLNSPIENNIITNLFVQLNYISNTIDETDLYSKLLNSLRVNEFYDLKGKNLVLISNNNLNKIDLLVARKKLAEKELENILYINVTNM